jgi:hypothetical protein
MKFGFSPWEHDFLESGSKHVFAFGNICWTPVQFVAVFVAMSFVSDTKETCLFWRNQGAGTKAYFRRWVDGKDRWLSLGELPLEAARERVRHLKQLHDLNLFDAKIGLVSRRSDVCSFGELFKAYAIYAKGVSIDESSVVGNRRCMVLILRRVKGAGFDVEHARVSLFNVQLLRDFSAAYVAARREFCEEKNLSVEQTHEKMESVQRTIRSTVKQARSLFCKAALCSSAYAKLNLPDMGDVMRFSVGATTVVPYEAPSAQVVSGIAMDVSALKEANAGLWLAFNLEVNAGFRRRSAGHARWDWFVDHGRDVKGERWVDLRVGVAKGGKSIVRFDAALYDEMVSLRKSVAVYGPHVVEKVEGAEYILPGDTFKERDAVCGTLVPWLRERGLDRRQPNHELRKLYGDRKYSEHGAEEAQRALGHSDSKLTSKVYASARARKSLRVF